MLLATIVVLAARLALVLAAPPLSKDTSNLQDPNIGRRKNEVLVTHKKNSNDNATVTVTATVYVTATGIHL